MWRKSGDGSAYRGSVFVWRKWGDGSAIGGVFLCGGLGMGIRKSFKRIWKCKFQQKFHFCLRRSLILVSSSSVPRQ